MESRVETLLRENVEDRAAPPAHPFLTGIHTPMRHELTLADLPVTGTIPAALNGRYLRIGPNPVAPDPAGYHWFIGDGMVHSLTIADGRATAYRNRWIRSTAVAAALGKAPAPGPRHHFDTVNTNVVAIAGRTYAMVEAGSYPVALSETLDDQRYDPFGGTLQGSFTAHPHLDPLTGESHAICYEGTQPGIIRHVVIDRDGRVVRELPIAVRHGPMIHDCAITARYVLILDLPVTFSMAAAIAGQGFPYRWNPGHCARIGLLPRDGGADNIVWCEMAPGFAFHVANAYDAPDGRVVLEVCAYDTMFAGTPGGPDATSRGFERWTIDPVTHSVAVTTIDRAPQEFPRIDERFFAQPHRYAWAMALPGGERANALYRHDLAAGTRLVHDFGAGRHPGEFVFVPAHADSGEGEGWLVGLVIDEAGDTTDLVVLDAGEGFAGDPVASIHLPHRIPPGFHGNWFPTEAAR